MRRLAWTMTAVLAAGGPASAHQLDEYLQATRVLVASDHVIVEIGLTPGVAIAPRILTAIDSNRDGMPSTAEVDDYVRRMLRDVTLAVDGRTMPLTITRVDTPSWDTIREGAGTIRVDARAAMPRLSAGRHVVRVVNRHAPEVSVYLANALVPTDRAIAIEGQRRDVRQHGLDLEVVVSRPQPAWLWGLLMGGAFVALAVGRFSGRITGRRAGVRPVVARSWAKS